MGASFLPVHFFQCLKAEPLCMSAIHHALCIDGCFVFQHFRCVLYFFSIFDDLPFYHRSRSYIRQSNVRENVCNNSKNGKKIDYVFLDFEKKLNPYVATGGIFYPPRRTFYAVALKPLRIVTKAFVTFSEYILAKNAEKKFSDISPSISNMAAEIWATDEKSTKILC